ncbi:MAG: type II methionyl aminopeptidase [Methanophagales archaeon]|nr:type II methionyl aminopeptidase [Methanophagales archaeon]MCW3138145.1 type II methionyl aminopeptidase [Methanophagales archaeon]MCW3139672.1 type II methionyl aminopeptidase [Methanophagales archaeon]MCW7069036.1 type II methionyl aminopeptidase [Methanophagales archaeon]MCW7072406.1 type II methionyl aminopeptidase [Methanophagales archaeon]
MEDELELELERILEKYKAAGKILIEVRDAALELVKPGNRLLDVAEFVESSIRDRGGEPAFPCNISRNEEAAHATPSIDDEAVFGEEDLVKLDIGVHIDGYIADSAVTVDLSGKYEELIRASEAALDEAIKIIHDGVSTVEIGEVIEEAIKERGYKPIVNLSGHGLVRYNSHAPPTIPNVKYEHGVILRTNDVIAIEPFATDGGGKVVESGNVEIYSLIKPKPVRMREAKKLLDEIKKYHGLPFARRWLPRERLNLALRALKNTGVLRDYPILREEDRGLVAQAEHTVIVKEDGCEVTTSSTSKEE